QLASDLPAGVTLTADGKMLPWDAAYATNYYKKKHFNIDETEIANYFPMEKTIKGLLDIYEQFFGLRFNEASIPHVWHEGVRLLEVYDAASDKLLGYFLLDLYPRDNKYSHACHVSIVPSIYGANNELLPALSLVIANFPQSTATKPSLLKRKDVTTFFHEFGHALHALLGRTQIASLSGTSVKRDFVEMPSQMLEEWLWDSAILKQVSGHYQTGAPLPDDLIERILALKNFNPARFVQTQLFYASLSLDYFKEGAQKDTFQIYKDLSTKILKHSAFSDEKHMYAAFGHLTGYGAKYYGYLWSKVFALDLFAEIKKHGLLNPEIGKKYVHDVIGRGGSDEPMVLLEAFLGREPNQEAFLKDLGLDEVQELSVTKTSVI
ncbi:MAG: M3 family metallopeptidase, partial [Candidatus Dependentiae bacterium]|nr:M3 family metallopeptidase [Candidatus Dependentiae bacterium]